MKKYYFLFGEGSKINQIICAVLINLQVFAYGASIGWMSPMTLLLQSEDSPRTPLTDTEVSIIGAIPYVVCIPSNFLAAYMGDRLGRKYTLIILSAAAVVAWVIKLSSLDLWAFILARSLIGVIMSCYVVCPLYLKEISEDSLRGFLGSWVIVFHSLGNLFLYVIGDMLGYYSILWVCLSLPTIHVLFFTLMPESPSFLIKKGKLEEAANVLAWLRCRSADHSAIQKEMELIQREQDNDAESNKFVLKALFSDKIMSRAFRIVMIVTLAREVCGAIPVLNFAGDIFANASTGSSLVFTPNQQAMMLGAVQVVGSALGSSIVEKSGRKPLLFITSLLSGLSMSVLATWFLLRAMGIWAPAWLPVVTLCLCIFCDASGLQPVSVVLNAEMFSFKYRGTVIASTMATADVADFFQMIFFKPLANSVGVHVAFYFFGIVCILCAVYVILVIPETKMRSIEEIYEKLKTKKEKAAEARSIQRLDSVLAKENVTELQHCRL